MSKKTNEDNNVIYVDGSKEAAANNLESGKRLATQRKILGLFVVVLLIVGAVLVYIFVNREYKGYRVVRNNETNYENTASYIQFCGNLLKYTPDGVSYINSSGNVVWSAGINMKMPVAVTSGSYAAVADISGNSVCVFNESGAVSSITMPYAICDVDIASQGAFAVVLESEKTNYINLYDKNGGAVYEIQTTIDKSGYPLDIAISDDGQKLFTSYINISGTSVKNNITAYNFGEVGQNSNADRMVGGYMFENQVIPKVEFINNDTVVAFGTNSINVYSMKEKPSPKASLNFDDEIRSVFYNSDYIGVVQDVKDGKGEHMYKIRTYDVHGKLRFEDYIDFNYDNIYAADKEIIISGEADCLIYRTNGSVKFSGSLSGKISSVVPSGNRLEYVVVYADKTEIIKLKTEAQSAADVSVSKETTETQSTKEENTKESSEKKAQTSESSTDTESK